MAVTAPVADAGLMRGRRGAGPRRPVTVVVADVAAGASGEYPKLALKKRTRTDAEVLESLDFELSSYENITVLSPGELAGRLATLEVSLTEVFLEDGEYDIVPLRKAGVDYQLEVRVVPVGDGISVLTTLVVMMTGERYRIRTLDTTAANAYYDVQHLANDIVATISEEEERALATQRVAVMCFDVLYPEYDRQAVALMGKGEWMAEDLPRTLAELLKGRGAMQVMDWSEIRQYCDSPLDRIEQAAEMGADAIVHGVIHMRMNEIRVDPVVVVHTSSAAIEMPSVSVPSEDYFDLAVQLAERIGDFLDDIRAEDGTWQLEPMGEMEAQTSPSAAYLERGISLYEEGETGLASVFIGKTLAAEPYHPKALYYQGLLRGKQGDADGALESLEAAVRADTTYVEAYEALGETYTRLYRTDDAVAAYERMGQLRSGSTEAVRKIADVYYLQRDYVSAEEQYRTLIADNPDDASVCHRLGVVISRQGRTEEAIDWYERALEVDPNHERARSALGSLLAEQGNSALRNGSYVEAVELLTAAIDYAPTPETYDLRGRARTLASGGDPEANYSGSIGDYMRSIELSESTGQSFYNSRYTHLNLLEAFILDGQYDEARAWARRILNEYEIREDSRAELIARFLLVTATVLQDPHYFEDSSPELEWLREDAAGIGGIAARSFKLIRRALDSDNVTDEQRGLIERLIEAVQRPAEGR